MSNKKNTESQDGLIYSGSVKDLLGPVNVAPADFPGKAKGSQSVQNAILFRYTDAYSLFDWGRMPDPIEGKGSTLAIVAADLFECMANAENWKSFSRTPEALALRKGISAIPVQEVRRNARQQTPESLSTTFNTLGEELQEKGLKSHYYGGLSDGEVSQWDPSAAAAQKEPLRSESRKTLSAPFGHLAVRPVSVVHPKVANVMGRQVTDYRETRKSPLPCLIPLEVIFRFSCPAGSSLIKRVKRDPSYLSSLALPVSEQGTTIEAGTQWDFPVLELSTKLEAQDRFVGLTEALSISGLAASQLQYLLLKTAWVAGFLKAYFGRLGLELADGKLEWGMDTDGEIFLVDAVGPDEVRLLKDGVQLSKEFLRRHYRTTPWYSTVEAAKKEADEKGVQDWKRFVPEPPPLLPPRIRVAGEQLYKSLANALTGKTWFDGAWSVDRVVEELRSLDRELSAKPKAQEVKASPEPEVEPEPEPDGDAKEEASSSSAPAEPSQTVLIVGGGAREHALAEVLSRSPRVKRLITAPGNDAMPGERWEYSGDEEGLHALAERARKEQVTLGVIGPEDPLVKGITDIFEERGIPCFGPSKAAAQIEGSKAFAKEIMKSAGVPTADHREFDSEEVARTFLAESDWGAWVVKADGLAAGKGVRICDVRGEALEAVSQLFPISGKLIVEEKLQGREISWMAFCDGDRCVLLDPARDYKPLHESNQGPNTGGMGAFSPVAEAMDPAWGSRIRKEVFQPVLEEMKRRGMPFKGLLYAGLMVDFETGRYGVLEFNARFGDPETQALLPRMEGDLSEWLEASALGDLTPMTRRFEERVPFSSDSAVYVVAASFGYPAEPRKGDRIQGLPAEGSGIFVAGARLGEGGEWETSGGRVLGALGMGTGLDEARRQAYERMEAIQFEGRQVRRDIAQYDLGSTGPFPTGLRNETPAASAKPKPADASPE